jgi:hypothetical protein
MSQAAAAKYVHIRLSTLCSSGGTARRTPRNALGSRLRLAGGWVGGNSANFHSSNEDKMQIRNTIYFAGSVYFARK